MGQGKNIYHSYNLDLISEKAGETLKAIPSELQASLAHRAPSAENVSSGVVLGN